MGIAAAMRHRGEMGGITSLEELDTAIRLVGKCDIAIERINQDMEMAVMRAKQEAERRLTEPTADRGHLLGLIETYVTANKEQVLRGKKTAKLNYGKVGWRSSSKLPLPPKGSEEMFGLVDRIEMLKQSDPERFVDAYVVVEKNVLATSLKSLADEALAELGLARIKADVFFVEPDKVRLRDLEGGS
ncbi:MAG: host-nuclease inhibitor Gam family protein [Thermodesulfobacteriota bacterium]